MVSRALLPVRSAVHPVASRGTPILTTAENTTSVLKVLPASTVAQLVPFSRSATLTAAEPAKIPKMFPDGEFYVYFFYRSKLFSNRVLS